MTGTDQRNDYRNIFLRNSGIAATEIDEESILVEPDEGEVLFLDSGPDIDWVRVVAMAAEGRSRGPAHAVSRPGRWIRWYKNWRHSSPRRKMRFAFYRVSFCCALNPA